MSEAVAAQVGGGGPIGGAQLLSYIEAMLLELAHMASAGNEQALAASLAICAIQAGARLNARD